MLPLILQGVGVQLAFPTITLLLLDRFPKQRGGISSMQAFASLLLCSVVAGVLSPLLSVSMLHLALGASALTMTGFVAWRWYGVVAGNAADDVPIPPAAATALQAEIVEPR
jgi:DHA1 family bicyclomycin/chloramphenicol resistance-like MFS transporter